MSIRTELSDANNDPKANPAGSDYDKPLLLNPTSRRLLVEAQLNNDGVPISITTPSGATSSSVQGTADTNAAKVGNPVLTAGLFQDPNTYDPNGTLGNVAPLALDRVTGAMLVSQRGLAYNFDSVEAFVPTPAAPVPVSITNATTSYVAGATIDLAGFERVSVFPNVTANFAATNVSQKIQWSMDGLNWFDNTEDLAGTPGGGFTALSQDVLIKTFSAAATGFMPLAVQTAVKRARYMRVANVNDDTNSVTVVTWIQAL